MDELEDDFWIQATNAIVELAHQIGQAAGRKPTADEFCEILAAALQSASHSDLFSDVSSASVAGLKPVLTKVPKKIQPGSIIGVPSQSGDKFLVVYLMSNRFGDVFGIFKGRFRKLPNWEKLQPGGRPVVSHLRPVREGRWPLLGIRSELASLFPAEPEIYHAKTGRNIENPAIGPYGSAETADNKLRSISKKEAEEVGLLSGEYRAVLLEERLVAYLERMMSQQKEK